MAETLAEQLELLRRLGSSLGEEFFQQGLTTLRAQHGDGAIDALLGPDERATESAVPTGTDAAVSQRSQHIGQNATIGVNGGGDVHGSVTGKQDGQPTPNDVVRAYAQQLISRLAAVPLHGLWEQKAVGDTPVVPLLQVYVEQALRTEIDRETFQGAALAALRDEQRAQALLDTHVGAGVLPADLRSWVRVFRTVHAQSSAALGGADVARRDEFIDLQALSADDLSLLVRDADAITLVGPQLVAEAIDRARHLVLLGEAGSGKSTVLRYLALSLAQQVLSAADPAATAIVPLFLPLQALAQRFLDLPDHQISGETLWQAIAAYRDRLAFDLPPIATLAELRDTDRLFLLLDGLDEVASITTRAALAEAVHQFALAYPQCRIVVTCRERVYRDRNARAFQLPRWPDPVLLPWNRAQMERFVAAWYAAIPDAVLPATERQSRAGALIAALQQRADLRRIGERPLLLTMATLVQLNDGRLAGSSSTLYGRCVDLLLGQWEAVGKRDSEFGSLSDFVGLPGDSSTLLPLLTRIAFAAHRNGGGLHEGSLRRNDLRVTVIDALYAADYADPVGGAERFLRYIDERAGLIQPDDSGDLYLFIHPSFKEYLAGRELIRGIEPVEALLAVRSDERWHAPILLAIGHLISQQTAAVPYLFLARLISPHGHPSQRQRDVLLAAAIGDDISWERLIATEPLFAQLRELLRQQLVGVVEGRAVTTAERVRAAGFLGALRDPRPGVCDVTPLLVYVPAGSVQLGSDAATIATVANDYARFYERRDPTLAARARLWPTNEANESWLELPGFWLARYPVTNAQYAVFLDADGYNPAAPWWTAAGRDWLQRDDSALDLRPNRRRAQKRTPAFWDDGRMARQRANHPVVGMNYYEACAFAAWLSQHLADGYRYRLPSEAEWEYAARGTTRRSYPWGEGAPTDDRANFGDSYGATTPVGCFPGGATPEGIADMAGNVWEWTHSLFRPYPYDTAYDTAELPAHALIVVRGGSWHSRATRLRAATRNRNDPDMYFNDLGFRLAADTRLDNSND
jgi:formylglycine-generating enzyme required for sulfatase activity